MTRKRLTAGELLDRLAADSHFAKRQRLQDEAHQQLDAELALAEAPIISDIRARGYDVASVWDLVNTKTRYADLVPILLEHFRRPYPERIREGIARALAVPESIGGWRILLDSFCLDPDQQGMGSKAGIAIALAAAANLAVMNDVLSLLRDRKHGYNRVFLLNALRRLPETHLRQLLMEFGADPQLQYEAQKMLCAMARRKKRAT